jgi:hypothetical protein
MATLHIQIVVRKPEAKNKYLMVKPIFYFEKLKPFDKWTIGLYIALTVGVFAFLKASMKMKQKEI